jgi:ketol-acid reductoisomerase
MAKIHNEGRVDLLSGKVAVLGYGAQGHAHALNLRDSGVEVVVGLREGSKNRAVAEEAGLAVASFAEAVRGAQLVSMLLPDQVQPEIYERDVAGNLDAGAAILFAHGFNILYKRVEPAPGHDVIMVAPKGPGNIVRRLYEQGLGTPAIVAVEQDASGNALELALAYGAGIGSGRAGMIETTFKEETETDLFGEQAVLCGGTSALVQAGWQTLVDAGYQPEIAYYECVHELKMIVDLIWEGGLAHMRNVISDTAEFGDLARGPRIVDDHVRESMRTLLGDIQDGTFAREWIGDMENGEVKLKALREEAANAQIEAVGRTLRGLMEGREAHGVR